MAALNSLGKVIRDYLESYFEQHHKHLPNGTLYKSVVSQAEAAIIDKILGLCEQNHSKAADVLGINRNTLARKVEELNIRYKPRKQPRRPAARIAPKAAKPKVKAKAKVKVKAKPARTPVKKGKAAKGRARG